eukprot:TRINITY_DN764_c0_g1_i1.p1 TRINITY_DN764_c0_g1~~TRINITY_DN764_c0_g1_i1.p1  ORF type:complete len:607 (-),score=39.44 TRINITY_DN764_c0_g1_i1:535-2355(-)
MISIPQRINCSRFLFTKRSLRFKGLNRVVHVRYSQRASSVIMETSPAVTTPSCNIKKVKRTVALYLAYIGTNFRGLQYNDSPSQTNCSLPTIEEVLERAIFLAAGISEDNFGDINKVKWNRVSRTDKGVHSLSTVITLKMLVKENDFDEDPEGLMYAQKINSHLPHQLQVLSVQRVTKKFNGRRMCADRTYQYYLPAWVLGFKGDGSAEDAIRQDQLKNILQQFVGYRPFHNYTKRAIYRKSNFQFPDDQRHQRTRELENSLKGSKLLKQFSFSKLMFSIGLLLNQLIRFFNTSVEVVVNYFVTIIKQNPSQISNLSRPQKRDEPKQINQLNSKAKSTSSGLLANGSLIDTVQQQQLQCIKFIESREIDMRSLKKATGDNSNSVQQQESDSESDEESESFKGQFTRAHYMKGALRFSEEVDVEDMVERPHYRTIRSFSFEGPYYLDNDSVACIKLTVTGTSFMLNQIRKMVGMVIAVMRGLYPVEFLRASMTAPARAILPVAPPETLVLAAAAFTNFRGSTDENPTKVAQWTGNCLSLRQGGQELQQRFQQQVLDRVMRQMLHSQQWKRWVEWLRVFEYSEQEMGEFLVCYQDTLKQKQSQSSASS